MSNYNKIVTTLAGSNMLVESINQKMPLIFTRVALGDGTVSDNESIDLLTDLKHKICDNVVESVKKKGNGEIDVVATISNSRLTTGFYARELGVFAKVGENGTEKLFAYTNAGSQASYTTAGTSLDEKLITITFYVGNAENVTINLNSQMYVTKDMLDSLKGAVEGKVDTYKSDADSKIAASKSTIEGLLNAHKADTTAHGLDKYAGGATIPSGIRNWNDLVRPGIYEGNASNFGWPNAPSQTKVYPYGQIQVHKTDGNVIIQEFYSFGQGKPCKRASRTFYNTWGTWQYYNDWDNSITEVTKTTNGINVKKGDGTPELLQLLTSNKADTNTALAPTLSVVKALIGDINLDISSLLKSKGVRYDFSSENAWFICMGEAFGGLIIQGGFNRLNVGSTPDDVTVTFPITFEKDNPTITCTTVFAQYLDDGWALTSLHDINKSRFKCKSAQNNAIGFKWIAFGA